MLPYVFFIVLAEKVVSVASIPSVVADGHGALERFQTRLDFESDVSSDIQARRNADGADDSNSVAVRNRRVDFVAMSLHLYHTSTTLPRKPMKNAEN